MRYFYTLLIVLGLIEQVKPQKWKFQYLDSNSGLSTETVNCTFKDSKGFIWIGTIDGLNKFDGYSITVYKSDAKQSGSISGNVITTIAEDFEGNIWIGTRNNGISIYDPKTEKFRKIERNGVEGLQNGAIQKILVANENNILIGLEEGGFCNYVVTDDKIINYEANPSNTKSLTTNSIFSIIAGKKNQFWIGNHRGGVDLFNLENQTFQRFTYDQNIEAGEIIRQILYFDKSDNLWIGTNGDGLIKLDSKTLQYKQYTKENSGLNSNTIKSIYQDSEGFIYLGTDGGGINTIDPNNDSFSYIENDLYDDESLSSNAVYEIYEDNSGIIWVSTFRGGVNFYSPFRNKFQLIEQLPDNSNSISLNSVIALEESKDGSIWIGTDGGGLDRLNPETNTFQHYTQRDDPNSISSNVPISLLEDNMGFLWVGTYAGGLNRFDPKTSKFKRYLPNPNDPNSIGSYNVWAIAEDSNNQLWFGLLDGGLAKYDKSLDGFARFTADGRKGSISSNLVVSLLSDSGDNLWVGTEDAGLNLFDKSNSTFKVIRNEPNNSNSLLNDNVRSIYEDQRGVLWVGTANGINQIDLKTMKITASSINDLLPNLVINGILEDESNNLWISTNRGLSKYSINDHKIQNFTTEDGLQGNEFNYTASFKSQDGKMYFGGIKGLNNFHPRNVKISELNPEVIISSIKLFDKSIYEYPKSELVIDKPIQYLEKIELRHNQNVLEIEFASLDYTSLSSNKYRYKLDGFDQEWSYTDANKRSANYTNLDPGDYIFRVEGTNSDGVWSSNARNLQIKVLAPWWATFWFRSLVFIILMFIIFSIYRWRRGLVIEQKLELEKRVEEATHQAKLKNDVLEKEQLSLQSVIEDTNYVIKEAIDSGNFSARIDIENKTGEWKALGDSINNLFDSIISPFTAINLLANSMAKSDLSKRFEDEEKGDVKKLMDNLNFALDNLSTLLRTIINQAEVITESSREMLVNSEEMNSSTQEISSSIAEMSSGAQSQAQRIDDTSNILESILTTSTDIGNQAEFIYSGSEKGTKLSNAGKKTIDQVEVGIKKVLSISNQTNDAIEMLSDRSSEISRVLKIINNITSQTNLLALNAAIEAAKAGDAGRGFSVVAEEIRKLADDSRKSTSDIESMISEIQNSIDATAKLINEMSGGIESSVDASSEASKTFTKISSSYESTLELSEKIVRVTKSQTSSVKQVVEFMENVVVIAEQTAAGTEEIASSANELRLGMNQSSDRIRKVSGIVEELRENVNGFTLDENHHE